MPNFKRDIWQIPQIQSPSKIIQPVRTYLIFKTNYLQWFTSALVTSPQNIYLHKAHANSLIMKNKSEDQG